MRELILWQLQSSLQGTYVIIADKTCLSLNLFISAQPEIQPQNKTIQIKCMLNGRCSSKIDKSLQNTG